ncbi:MAG: ribbon-helix-helix protein, CopG family [Chloroflexi bacterium]|nr:ribbon-helix-helix protein, CopG family [Chloroflexota bacterium]
MRKTSVYLEDNQVQQLRRVAERERRSQAEVLRDAIKAYVERAARERDFVMAGVAEGPGDSVADIPEEELLKGFGA